MNVTFKELMQSAVKKPVLKRNETFVLAPPSPPRRRRVLDPEEKKQRRRISNAKYRQSEKGKAARKRAYTKTVLKKDALAEESLDEESTEGPAPVDAVILIEEPYWKNFEDYASQGESQEN